MGIIRKTQSVKTLLKEFEQSKKALSAIELVERFNGQMNKTTVYRILERLEDDGSLHSFTGKDGLKWYALCHGCTQSHHVDKHPHFQCRDCGKTECLSLDIAVPSIPNYKVEIAELLLIGQCENCLS
ncbi:MAG: Fur family ferric uptake transcriptional regulator [Saprospiraceae bacterium]|jgi:Fur family ferric uptake transcriptional regulator